MPGLGVVLGARVLGEFGDDPERYDSAKSRRNYAGTSPLTVASGRKRTVRARFIRNLRLYDAADQWAMCSLRASPGLPRLLRPPARRRRPPPPGAARPRQPPRSATCTAASEPAPATTSPPHGNTVPTTRTSLLDRLESWGVYPHSLMGHVSGPVHEGTSCFQGALPTLERPCWTATASQSPVARHHVQWLVCWASSQIRLSLALLVGCFGAAPCYAASCAAASRNGS